MCAAWGERFTVGMELHFNNYLSVSGPFLAMIIFNFPSPPTGALSVPVVNCKKSLFCSSVNEWTTSQNSLMKKDTILVLIWHYYKHKLIVTTSLRTILQLTLEIPISSEIYFIYHSSITLFTYSVLNFVKARW